jgi:riboflavin kinase / FMN adenylyltransferase
LTMKIYRDISEIEAKRKAVVTVGTFDGIHKGHADIIDFVVEEGRINNLESFVVTFEPHPRLIVSDNSEIKILTTLEEKVALFEKLNVQNLLVVNFNREFADLSYEDFLKSFLLDRIGAEHIVIGHDHHFGKGRGGNENKLLALSGQMNFKLTVISAVDVEGTQVSSSKVREAILGGDLGKANSFLGRNYALNGIVVEGVQRGRELGFPTANIEPLNKYKLIPKNGVYAVKGSIGNTDYNGVLNIGKRPTFELQDKTYIELHIFDFKEDIYAKPVYLEFVKRIRDEKKFNSTEELIEQINEDIEQTKQIFK